MIGDTAEEQLIREINIRLPTALSRSPAYATYLGRLLHVAYAARRLTRHEVGIQLQDRIALAALECYADPDRLPHRIGCDAGWVTEFDAEGQVTRSRGVLSLSSADQERLAELLLTACS